MNLERFNLNFNVPILIYLENNKNEEKMYTIDEYFTVGSDESNTLVIKSEKISARHLRIEKRGDDYIVKDLRSLNGTYVNDTKILESYLYSSDCISIGDAKLFFLFKKKYKNQSDSYLQSNNVKWNETLQNIPKIANTDFPVLILGPSGSGKEIIAQKIHEYSPRKHFPFISVNCCALSESLIESELFGHIKGSFTGASYDRKGAFEAARNGTLFLDEIGDLPFSLQAKLLRTLESGEIKPVGSDKVIKTNVRIITATHQNLNTRICQNKFRSDLFYRISVVNIFPPSLIERKEDLEKLIYFFAKQYKVRFSFNAIKRLKQYNYPGNIRELKNVVIRAKALFPDDYINEEQIDFIISPFSENETSTLGNKRVDNISVEKNFSPVIKEIEKELIVKRLEVNRGNQRRTAEDLGMPKSTLHDKLKNYQIDAKKIKRVYKQ